jgi:hypothetical protein
MTEPYVKANPGDPILSEQWNTIQVRMIEALRTHTHLGGDDGKKLGGGGIDPDTTVAVKQVDASTTLTVRGLNVHDRITGLGNEKLAVTGGTVSGTLTVNGNVGIGATTPPKAKLDIQEVARSGAHPATVRGLYVTGEFGGEADGVEFRHSNGTQGVGIGHNTLYATGSNADQDLGLKARGNGKVTIRGDLKIGGPSLLSATGRRILETNAGDDWLRVNGNTDYKSIALYSTVAIGEGGLSIGEWAQLPKGNLKATGTIHAEQDLLLGRNANNMRFIAHSRNGANGDFLHLTSDKADGSWDWTNGIVLKRGGGVGLGTQSPNKKLTVDYAGSTTDHATAEFRQTGSNSWGMALVVRTVGGNDGAGVLFRSRTKNWQIRGETGAASTGFQITEDGGDAEYGSGFGTPRLHISAGGDIGIGTTTPKSELDIQAGARSGEHAQGRPLYVTGNTNADSNGIEFRHTNGSQGIGFGHNTVYATGSNPDQDLNLQARGGGIVRARVNTNTVQLERTLATSGKALFLELYQGTAATADVFPSIRFHHGNHYWIRIESSNSRFHFKQGHLDSDEYVDLSARSFSVGGGENVAPGCPEQVRLIRGFVNPSGGTRGKGFTAKWASSGLCDITFDKAFGDAPVVVATQMFPGSNEQGGDTRDNAVVISSSTTRVRIKTGGGDGSAANRDFHFVAFGT